MRQRDPNQMRGASIRNLGSSSFGYSFGYSLFLKRQDPKSARGWTQQSFVIISELNLVGFFYRLLQQIAMITDDENCQEIQKQLIEQSLFAWPAPLEA